MRIVYFKTTINCSLAYYSATIPNRQLLATFNYSIRSTENLIRTTIRVSTTRPCALHGCPIGA